MAVSPGLQLFANEPAFRDHIQASYDFFYQEWQLRPNWYGNDDRPRDFASAMFLRPSLLKLLDLNRDYMTARLVPSEEWPIVDPDTGETTSTYKVGASVRFNYLTLDGSGSMSVVLSDEDEAYIDMERRIRPSDMVARDLYDAGFGPVFQYYWPRDKRDRAIDELRKRLKTEQYTPTPTISSKHDDWWFSSDPIARSGPL